MDEWMESDDDSDSEEEEAPEDIQERMYQQLMEEDVCKGLMDDDSEEEEDPEVARERMYRHLKDGDSEAEESDEFPYMP